MNDLDIKSEVRQALDWEPELDARAIDVFVKDGVVTLTGSVTSYPEKHAAEKAAGLIRAVKAVACELVVALPPFNARSDQDIARAAADAIEWNTLLGQTNIQIFVDKGRITLEGAVNWDYQRQSADRSVRYLPGVRDVNNHIVVEPKAEQIGTKRQVEASVQSWIERDEAERDAWASRGMIVENELIANPVPALRVR